MPQHFSIREIRQAEYAALGQILVSAYSQLDGFLTPEDQPAYYDLLANVGQLTEREDATVLVAISPEGQVMGGCAYFSVMANYNPLSPAQKETNSSGIRLLAIDPKFRRQGLGKALTQECIRLARENGHAQVILHTTQAMQNAWKMYTSMGFQRAPHFDFIDMEMTIYGFQYALE